MGGIARCRRGGGSIGRSRSRHHRGGRWRPQGGDDGRNDNNNDLDDDKDDDASLLGGSGDGDKNGNCDNEEVVLDAIAVEVKGHDTNVDIATEVAGNDGRDYYDLNDNTDDDESLFGSSVDGDKNGDGDNEDVASDAVPEADGHDTNADITTKVAGNDGQDNNNLEDNSDNER